MFRSTTSFCFGACCSVAEACTDSFSTVDGVNTELTVAELFLERTKNKDETDMRLFRNNFQNHVIITNVSSWLHIMNNLNLLWSDGALFQSIHDISLKFKITGFDTEVRRSSLYLADERLLLRHNKTK